MIKIVPMTKDDTEKVEILFYRYQGQLDILNFLVNNSSNFSQQVTDLFEQKWDKAMQYYTELERVKAEMDAKYRPEGNWPNYTFNFINQRLEYINNDT